MSGLRYKELQNRNASLLNTYEYSIRISESYLIEKQVTKDRDKKCKMINTFNS